MGQDNNKGGGDTEVSAYEHELTKQGKVNKGIKTSTYGETKTSSAKDESDFHVAGQKDSINTPFTAVNVIGNLTLGWTNAGSKKTREFFTDKVLTSKGVTHKGTHYGKESFNQLSAEKKEEIYGGYMDDRLSGKTDAYGNPTGGWRKETIKHKKADGTYVDKEVWMGGNDNGNRVQKSNFQLEQENAAAEAKAKAESEAKEQAAKDQADAYKKKRTAMVGSRSLFANPGGRGFFN